VQAAIAACAQPKPGPQPPKPVVQRSVVQRADVLNYTTGYNLPFGGDGGDGDDPRKPFQFPKPHYETKLTFKRRLRKSTQKKSTAQILSSISTSTSSMRTRKRVEREQLEEEFEERGVLYIQPIPPIVDRNGRIVWNGHRNHISWYPGFLDAHHNESKGSNRRGLDDPSPPVYVGPCTCGVSLLSASKKIRRNKNQDL
jgi:hypothetical protein